MSDQPEGACAPEEPVAGPSGFSRRAVLTSLVAVPVVGAGAAVAQMNRYDASSRDDLPSPDVPAAIAKAHPAAIAASKGLVFGSCVNGAFRQDPQYRAVTLGNSNTLIHGAAGQWLNVQQRPGGPYDFAFAEQIYAWARNSGREFRGHAIIDWTYLPQWLPSMVDQLDVRAAAALFEAHVHTMASHWRGRFTKRMVVNEACSSSGLHQSIWSKKLGEDYIDLAFNLTHAADAATPLMINDSEIEMDTDYQRRKLDSYLSLIQRLIHRKVPIRSVGIEGHLKSDSPVNQKGLEAFMQELARMNLGFTITELDVDDRGLPNEIRIRDSCVAAIMRDLLDVALAQQNCDGVMCWDFCDRQHWIVRDKARARSGGGAQRPTLLDQDYAPKAAWATVVDCLKRAAGPSAAYRSLSV